MVIHGTKDMIIYPWHGKSLYKRAIVPKSHYWVTGADHNNVISVAGKAYFEKIWEFVDSLTPLPPLGTGSTSPTRGEVK